MPSTGIAQKHGHETRSGAGKTKGCSAQRLGRGGAGGAAPRDGGEGSPEGAERITRGVWTTGGAQVTAAWVRCASSTRGRGSRS